MLDETISVFDHVNPQPQLHRHAGLALADPLGVRLEEGEDLFLMGDAFTLEHPMDGIWCIFRSRTSISGR